MIESFPSQFLLNPCIRAHPSAEKLNTLVYSSDRHRTPKSLLPSLSEREEFPLFGKEGAGEI
jgi:hypothetical protein